MPRIRELGAGRPTGQNPAWIRAFWPVGGDLARRFPSLRSRVRDPFAACKDQSQIWLQQAGFGYLGRGAKAGQTRMLAGNAATNLRYRCGTVSREIPAARRVMPWYGVRRDPEIQGLLERVYAHLHSSGQWPELEAAQWQIASEGRSQNVRAAVMKPLVWGAFGEPAEDRHQAISDKLLLDLAQPTKGPASAVELWHARRGQADRRGSCLARSVGRGGRQETRLGR
jgi:hypothetical protein